MSRSYGAILGVFVVEALFLVTREFKTMANPLICALCNSDTLISRLSIVPFGVSGQNARGALHWRSCASRVLAVRLPFEQFVTHSQAKHFQNGRHQVRLGLDSKPDHQVLHANDEDKINRKRI